MFLIAKFNFDVRDSFEIPRSKDDHFLWILHIKSLFKIEHRNNLGRRFWRTRISEALFSHLMKISTNFDYLLKIKLLKTGNRFRRKSYSHLLNFFDLLLKFGGLFRPTLQSEKKTFGVRKKRVIPYFQAPRPLKF